MENIYENINKYIEHTLLRQDATREDLNKLLDEAKEYDFLGVCVNPTNVEYSKKYLKGTDIKVVTVLGFPLGYTITPAKVIEAMECVKDGADEVDAVLNVSLLKDKDYDYAMGDIVAIKNHVPDTVLKVIIETDLLTKEEIQIASEIACQAGANFVKTSTGFVKNGVGATVENIQLIKKVTQRHDNVQIKASGGIKTYQDAIKLIRAGATRIGTSSGVAIVEGANRFD